MKKYLISIPLAVSLLMPLAARADITTGLVGWWRFDEGSGTTAIDSSGMGNTGTLTNGPSYVAGQVGPYALSYPAANNPAAAIYVSVPNSTSLNLTGSDATFSMWINPVVNNWSTNYTALFTKRGGGDEYEVYLHVNTGTVGFFQGNLNDTSFAPPTGAWTQVVVVVSGSNCIFYFNGALNGTDTGACGIVNSNTSPVTIGFYNGGGGDTQQFWGSQDDVRVYNRALSAGDVAQLYAFTGLSFQSMSVYAGNILRIFSGSSFSI